MNVDRVLDVLVSEYSLPELHVIERVGENVLRVATSAGELAAKTFAPAERDRGAREAQLLTRLAAPDVRFRVQVLVPTARGDALVLVDEEALVVTRWCTGAKKSYTQITVEEWHALGRELAALHVRLDDHDAALPRLSDLGAGLDVDGERTAIEASRTRALAKAPDRAAEIGAYLDARRSLLDARAERGLAPPPTVERAIHNDYNQHNYLFDGILPPVILDWEGAIAAAREYEVVRCLNHLPLVAPTHASAFVAGYRSVRALDSAALRWAIDRALTEHAVKSWPLERWLSDLPGADAALAGSMEVVQALATRTSELEAFFSPGGLA